MRPARRHRLRQRNLFIFPSRAGFGFLFVNVLLWLTGTNYENNLVLACAFLQTSMFLVCIHHTFFNLSGLSLEVLQTSPGYAGDQAELEIEVQRPPGRGRENIQIGVDSAQLHTIDLIDSETACIKVFVPVSRRGWQLPPRLLVQSSFPLGWVRCWTWLAFDAPILVYPRPVATNQEPRGAGGDQEGEGRIEEGSEDFHGFQRYQPGMPVRHIAWKQYARGRGLYSKEYVASSGNSQWLDWFALEGLNTETRLSRLCYWVRCLGERQPLGLRMPDENIAPGLGVEHQRRLLKTLALYQRGDVADAAR